MECGYPGKQYVVPTVPLASPRASASYPQVDYADRTRQPLPPLAVHLPLSPAHNFRSQQIPNGMPTFLSSLFGESLGLVIILSKPK